MSGSSSSSVYIGNLDERVSDRVLYDILIQAGRVVDLHMPRDRETDRPKGYAFAEYETLEIADYAVKLFSGVVTLYNRTLKFAISGQDKKSQTPPNGLVKESHSFNKDRSHPASVNNMEVSHQSMRLSPCSVSAYPANYSQVPPPPGVSHHSNGYNGLDYENGRRDLVSDFDPANRSWSRRYDTSNTYSTY